MSHLYGEPSAPSARRPKEQCHAMKEVLFFQEVHRLFLLSLLLSQAAKQ